MNHKRQVNIFDPFKHEDVTVGIIGLGNIGSHSALAIARMGILNFELWDDDTVEEHNVTSQTYSQDQIGTLKVNAVASQINSINPEANVTVSPEKFSLNLPLPDIFVIGVDSLDARRDIAIRLMSLGIPIIDGRCGGEQLEVYTSTSAEEWVNTIPEEASEDDCGGRYIAYVSSIIGGIIASQVKKVILKQEYPKSFMMNMGNYDTLKNYEW